MRRGLEVATVKMAAAQVVSHGPIKIMLQRRGLTMPLKEVVLVSGLAQTGQAEQAIPATI